MCPAGAQSDMFLEDSGTIWNLSSKKLKGDIHRETLMFGARYASPWRSLKDSTRLSDTNGYQKQPMGSLFFLQGMASKLLLPTLLIHWAAVLETYVQGYEEPERQSNTPEAASMVAFPRVLVKYLVKLGSKLV